ncbi:MAG: four helix bundle protein [Candidatus Omnitrophota bacterium]
MQELKKPMKSFRDLMIWQRSVLLAELIYQKTECFPKAERYGLVSQMRRAAVSIPSNIAEGYRRRHAKEFQQFLNIALGSIGELETQVVLATRFHYLSLEDQGGLSGELDSLVRTVVSLSKKIQR